MTSLAVAEEPITISIMHYMGNQVKLDAFNEILNKYMETHPNVTFESQMYSQNDYIAQLPTENAQYQIRCAGYQFFRMTRWRTSAKGTKATPTACDLASTLTGDCLSRNACKGYAVCRRISDMATERP